MSSYKFIEEPKHYAANGRTITACGEPTTPNGLHNGVLSPNSESHKPKCKKCQRVLASAAAGDLQALVITSQDDRPDALRNAEAAYREALTLCKTLGEGWKPHVWHNLRWHWNALYGGLKVHPYKDYDTGKISSYSAFLGVDDGGLGGGTWVESAKTPQAAIKKVMDKARAEIREQKDLLTAAERNLGKLPTFFERI